MGGSESNMALFELEDIHKVAVDNVGRAVVLDSADATALHALMDKTIALQEKNNRIQCRATCRPFTILSVAISDGAFEKFRIYGYGKSMRDLEKNAGLLTDSLWELYGLADEGKARDGNEIEDEDVLKAVKERVKHLH
ncbi:hypothetical protein E6O75_ATG06919 [Venturia nashicola]|uniref:Uncharacterized protein n=1 Tax=Venturia nashicola TaxID=86259 RepID=A0A4Z1PE49_9PEZI|nr:hypothetical protein E6O75_ATG06919 [Venturia nashicola]